MTISKQREVAAHDQFEAVVTVNPLLNRRSMH
jgi:hypothetical protein